MRSQGYAVNGAGLGLRRSFIDEIMQLDHPPIDFIEVAPENWMEMGGRLGKKLRAFSAALLRWMRRLLNVLNTFWISIRFVSTVSI